MRTPDWTSTCCPSSTPIYKELLVSTAKELWRRHHPDRDRLPKNFEDSLCLKFYELKDGSAAVPIFREIEITSQPDMFQTEQPDELDEAVLLVTEAIEAANSEQLLPHEFPKKVIALFEGYGKTLREDECIELRPEKGSLKASYSPRSREQLLKFAAEGYIDRIDLSGEVRAVDLTGRFELKLDDGTKIPPRFSPEQESVVTETLRDHVSRRLRVKGTAEFQPDGRMKAVTKVMDLEIRGAGEVPFDPTAKPIWQIAEEIAAQVPPEEWEKVPRDGAENLHHYLYGAPKKD